jgi:hypothetical protein
MSDVLIIVSKHSNGTFIMVTLVIWGWCRLLCIVYELLNIQMLIDLNCMLSVGCKPMMLITLNFAKTYLKVFGGSRCRHVSLSPTWSPCMSRSWSLGHVRSVLLSIVTQSLLCWSFMCKWSLSLLAMFMVVISGKTRLLRVGLCTRTHRRCRLLRKVFTSRVRWMSLYHWYERFC